LNDSVRCTIAALVILLVGSCAARTVPTAPETPPPVVTPPPAIPSPADNNYLEGFAMMQQGKYERALELFAAAWKKEPGYPGVEENFPAALEGLKKSGDDAYEQGKLGEAGKRWAATMRYLSHPALKAGSPTISKAGLQGSIDKVSEILMEKGLADYRQGRLEEAIATWRQILAYDPAHEEAARSLKTATTQLKNLKKITPPAPGK
jgi:tetratricopeptide (TPR) repeat protein